MLKNNIHWPDHRKFKSQTEYEPLEFFSECLRNSTRFDFFLGFFSSSAISLLSCSFATFIHNGGKMRLIINNILSEEDKIAIENGYHDNFLNTFDINNLASLRETLSQRDQHFFDCLSWMIAHDKIEIKIVRPKNSNGISHTKEGVFYDDIDLVSFNGSCNFSKTALIDNIESITAFCSWDAGPSWANVADTRHGFDLTFSGLDPSVEYLDSTQVISQVQQEFPCKEIRELLQQERELLEEERNSIDEHPQNERIMRILQKAKKVSDQLIEKEFEKINSPHFPYPSGPREYQKEAFENWKANRQKGLFAMATGTGKTITALNCLLEIYNHSGYYKALILVPTIALLEQWEEECHKFHFTKIIKVSSKNHDWKNLVAQIRMQELGGADKNLSYIIIATYASFGKPSIFEALNGFSHKQLLFIADEAHNMGSGQIIQKIEMIKYLRRIGLSATPQRQYDDSGNRRLAEFFGSPEAYTYEYSMEKAIQTGALCRYKYYPHIVRLTDMEMTEYKELSEKIVKIMNFQDTESQEILTRLLIKRKRIIHQAENKKLVFQDIINQQFASKGDLSYTLVYVPEGNKADDNNADIFESEDRIKDDIDTQHLINHYTKIICDTDEHVTVRQFTSDSADRSEILKEYAAGKIQVLTSMKCLDEGVDVPRSETAIFCSSTGNPRQFIQRRGRVLRQHPNKHMATIHDLIVVPENRFHGDSYQLERNLVETEMKRVRDFAFLSENLHDTDSALNEILDQYNLPLFN